MLRHQLEQAEIPESVRLQFAARGLPPPGGEPPELLPGLDWFVAAFHELSTCRSVGMGEGPIPWTAVQKYCEAMGLRGPGAHAMHHHIRAMDREYLEIRAKQEEARRKRREANRGG